MKTFKYLALPCLLLIFSTTGCLTSLQRQFSPPDVMTVTSGVTLALKTSTSTYTSKEPISLELSIQGGEFNLFVPFIYVATSGAFTHLKVTDTDGNVVEPKRPITLPSPEEIIFEKEGKSVQCIRGFELKSVTTQIASVEDVRKYYAFQKGSYTIALTMELPVYRDSLQKRNPEIMELEEEIKRIKKVTDAHVSAADKRSAVNDLQRQIERLEKRSNDIYLPVRSLLGKASLTSNVVVLTIE